MPGTWTTHPRKGWLIAVVTIATITAARCAPASSPEPSDALLSPSRATPAITMAPSPTALSSSSPSASSTSPGPTGALDVAAARWVPAGERAIELQREDAAASGQTIALPDGAALRIGRHYGRDDIERMVAQLWEPATAEWRDTTPLAKMRSDFAALALRDGRVLVVGGFNGIGASYSSAYIFDRGTETWTKTGLMTQARTAPAAALLPDGRVLVAGGYFFDPERASSIGPRVVLAAARLPADDGGDGTGRFDDVDMPPRGRALATAEVFDPVTGTWSSTGSLRYARAGAAAVTLTDGRVLVTGASDLNVELDDDSFGTAEIYDPANERFTRAGEFPPIDVAAIRRMGVEVGEPYGPAGRLGTLVALRDGDAVLIGHENYWKHEAQVVRSFRFGAHDDSWTEIGQPFAWNGGALPEARTASVCRLGAIVALLADDSVFVVGGESGGETGWGEGAMPPLTSERYDPADGTWSPMLDVPAPLFGMEGVGLAGGSVLIVGGGELRGSGDDQRLEWAPTSYRLAIDGG